MTRSKLIITVLLVCLYSHFAFAGDPVYHIVAKGETLYGIAHMYKVSVDALMQANDIKDAKKIIPGMKLVVPQSEGNAASTGSAQAVVDPPPVSTIVYTVKKDETLYSIARKFNTSVQALTALNKLTSSSIKAGQKLVVPGAPSAASTTVAAPKPGSAPTVDGASRTPPAITKPTANSSPAVLWPCSGELSYIQGKLSGVSISGTAFASMSAIRAGTVISVGPIQGFDNVAFIQSKDGLMYVYGGLRSLKVRQGDAIRKGSLIGTLGSGPGALAYFFVFNGSKTLDPAKAPRD